LGGKKVFNLVEKAWAMAAPPQGAAEGAPSGMASLMQFVPLLLIFVVFYFLLIRPQQKKQKELREMIDGIRKGDKVITTGGVYGVVENVKEHSLVLKIADKVKIEVLKNAVQSKR
jgi:preprotein translocase subunit YajC